MSKAAEEFSIAMLNYEPFVYHCANNTPFTVGRTLRCLQPGVSYELFQIYVQAMAVKPKIVWVESKDLGAYEKTRWTGALGMILNGTLDTIAHSFQYTDLRGQFFDFSYSFYDIKLVYLVKEARLSGFNMILDVFSPFSLNVWIVYLATILALLIAFSFIRISNKRSKTREHLNSTFLKRDILWDFFRFLINSCGNKIGQESIAERIVFISGGVFALIMMNLYGNLLLSELIYDRRLQPFTTAQDVIRFIEQKKYKLILDLSAPSFWYHEETRTSNETHYVQLRKALTENPYAYADNKSHALQMVLEGGYVMPALTDDSVVYRAFKLCEIDLIMPEDGPLKMSTYIFRKKSPFIKRFNSAIYSTQRLTDRVWGVYYGDVAKQKRAALCKRPKILSPLSLDNCTGLLALILIGFSSAAAVFFGEIIRGIWTRGKVGQFDTKFVQESLHRLESTKYIHRAIVRFSSTERPQRLTVRQRLSSSRDWHSRLSETSA